MKKLLPRLLIGVVILVIVMITVVFLSLGSIVKKGVELVGPRLTGTEVKLAAAEISPFSGSGKLSQFFVGNPDGYKTPSAIQVGSVKVAVEVGTLLSDVIVIDEINVQSPMITLEGTLSGNNLSAILDHLAAGGATPATNPPASTTGAAKEKKFIVKQVVIDGGQVNLSMSILGGKEVPVPLPPVHLQDIGTAENGVTASQMATAIMRPLLAGVTTSAEAQITHLGKGVKDLGRQEVDQVRQLGKGLNNLFK